VNQRKVELDRALRLRYRVNGIPDNGAEYRVVALFYDAFPDQPTELLLSDGRLVRFSTMNAVIDEWPREVSA